jgi:general secretion pathway protein G
MAGKLLVMTATAVTPHQGEEDMQTLHARKQGFSLLEIVIVGAVISVVMAIALPNFVKARNAARQAQAEADVELLASAVRQLAWDTGKWPMGLVRSVLGDSECWDLSVPGAGLVDNDGRFSSWKGPYIAKVPKDPWGSDYFFDPDYNVGGTMVPVVGSFGPNRVGRNKYDSDDLIIVMD